MLQKKSMLEFLRNIIEIFGISIISISLFVIIFGNNAKEISSMFKLGSNGIAIETLMQFLLLSIILTILKYVLFTDRIIKRLSITARFISMIVCIIVIVGILTAIFSWFPVNKVIPWILFLISFAICTIISILVSKAKEKNENEKLQKALEKLKKEIE